MVFFASDGANANSGLKSGLITVFQENGLHWVSFIWCLSHRLELALKDSLSDAMSDVHEVLTSLFLFIQEIEQKALRITSAKCSFKDV